MYKKSPFPGAVIRISDGASIPRDPDNKDYVDFLQWEAAGGVLQEADNFAPALEGVKERKLQAINDNAIKVAASLTAGYPTFEMQTWPQQEAESRAWNIDNSAPTPMIDVMAATRGIPRELFLRKTLEKVTQFRQASAYLVGLRQRYEDQLNFATTVEEVEAINPVYAL